MTWPSRRDWIFSAKTFTAAILALYVALSFGLPRPYWAMTAVYVVANPLSGATVAKALDRTFGTILGGAGAVVLVALLADAPEMLMLAIALWAGTLLYIAMHGRTPRNYVFLLAGYTLPLIVLPNAAAPGQIFDIALSRTEEILVGILAAAVIGTIILPMSLRPALAGRIARWLEDAGAWAREILLAHGAEPATPLARQRLAADIAPLTTLLSQLPHDAGTRDLRRDVEELRGRLLLLLPLLSSIADRMYAVSLEAKEFPPGVATATTEIAAWMEAPAAQADAAAPERLRALLGALPQPAPLWDRLMQGSLAARLGELVDLWEDCLTLQQRIALTTALPRWRPMLRHRPVIGRGRHHDHGLMLFTVGSTVLATFLAGLLWIGSGWTGGAMGVAFVAIACCFFGSLDRPAPMIRTMLVWCCVVYLATGFYLFAILPQISDFELLALVLAPPFLLIGAFIPRPEFSLVTLLLAANFAGDLNLQERYSADFAAYAEGGLAIAAGLAFALVWTLVTRPFGAEVAARRLVRAGWADLAALAAGTRPFDHAELTSRTLDRLGQLVPRLAADTTPALGAIDGLAELRAGYNIIALQRDRRALPPPARAAIDQALAGVAAYFRRCAGEGRRGPAPEALLGGMDTALRATLRSPEGQPRRAALDALVGLRRALFPAAPGPRDEAPALPMAAE